MSRYCLDTVTYSHFKRGHQHIAQVLDRADWIGVPTVVIGELCAGFAGGSRYRENLEQLDEFLSATVVEVLPVDRRVAVLFGQIVVELWRLSRPIPTNDMWIAAACWNAGATLLTFDRHFAAIPGIGTLLFE
jgi:tRNA(fMet)-specific endonuclease VapC